MKSTSKPSFVKQKIFDNNLAAINNIKTNLTLKLLAYLEMLVIELSKCQCINFIMMISKENMPKNRDYDSHILTVWCLILKLKMLMWTLVRMKKKLIWVIILLN